MHHPHLLLCLLLDLCICGERTGLLREGPCRTVSDGSARPGRLSDRWVHPMEFDHNVAIMKLSSFVKS